MYRGLGSMPTPAPIIKLILQVKIKNFVWRISFINARVKVMITKVVNFPFKNTSIHDRGTKKFSVKTPTHPYPVIDMMYTNIKLYEINSPHAYNVHPSNNYGFIIMDQDDNILMIENPVEDLEIPYISTFEMNPAEGEKAPPQTIFFIKNVSDYKSGFCVYFSNYAVTHLSAPALNHYFSLNKERRRNAKILG